MAEQSTWQVEITETAAEMIRGIKDTHVRGKILEAIAGLQQHPERGKPMVGELASYRSLRAVGQRHRILYQIQAEKITVYVVAVGISKEGDRGDIYELTKKLLRLGLLPSQ